MAKSRTLIGTTLVALAMIAAFAPSASGLATTTPNPYSFGTQTVGTTSAPVTFTLNVRCTEDPPNPGMCQPGGNDPLTPNVTVSGEFAIVNNNCTALMPGNTTSGTNCTFGVVFAPASAGSKLGIVDVGHMGGFGTAGVSGTGVALPPPPLAQTLPVITTSVTPTSKKKCKRKRSALAAKKKCRKKK